MYEMTKQHWQFNFIRTLARLGTASGIFVAALSFTACDPNGFNPRQAIDATRQLARQPSVPRRLAMLVCSGAQSYNYNNINQTNIQGQNIGRQGPVTVNATNFFALSIDTSGAYNLNHARGFSRNVGVTFGITGSVKRLAIPVTGNNPSFTAFNKDGRLNLTSVDNHLVAVHSADNGVFEPLGVIRSDFRKPTRILLSDEFGYVLDEGTNKIGVIAFDRIDAVGRPLPRIYGTPRTVVPNGEKIVDIGLRPDLGDNIGDVLYVVTNVGRLILFKGAELAGVELTTGLGYDYNLIHPQSVINGGRFAGQRAGSRPNLVAVSPNGFVAINGQSIGPYILSDTGGLQGNFANNGVLHRIKPGSTVDMEYTTNGAGLLVLTRNQLHSFDMRQMASFRQNLANTAGFQRDPAGIGTNNKDLAIDPEGEFALVVGGDQKVHLVRMEPDGQITYDNSFINVGAQRCINPVSTAVRPKGFIGSQQVGYPGSILPNLNIQ